MSMVDPEGRGLPPAMRHVSRRSTADAVPVASSVTYTGGAVVGTVQTGSYTYTDARGDLEATSTFRWLLDGSPIIGATSITYTPIVTDQGHTLAFEVTPVAASGLSPGTAVASSTSVVAFPTPAVANPYAWYRADLISGLADGASVASWTDISGNGRNATGAANKPVYKTAIQNGLAVVRFLAASSQYMTTSTAGLAQPLTIVATVTATSGVGNRSIINAGATTAAFFFNGSHQIATFGGSSVPDTSGVADDACRTVSGVLNGASSTAHRGDGTAVSGNAGAGSPANYGVGGNNTNFFDGDIMEIFIHASALSTANIDLIATEQKNRWVSIWTNL